MIGLKDVKFIILEIPPELECRTPELECRTRGCVRACRSQ